LKKLLLVAVLAIVGAITGCEDAKFPYLTSVAVSPGTASVQTGATQQFTAQGTFSNGATRDLTSLVTWTSSSPSVASIVAGGLATAQTPGSSTIMASFIQPGSTVSGTATLTVTAPTLTSIQVSPGTASVGVGATQQFTAQGTFSNGTTRDITSEVTWTSSSPSVASIVATGLATAHSQGSSTITASFTQASGTVTGTATLTVTAATLTSIQVSPVDPSVAAGLTQQFTAQGTFSDGTTRDITSEVTWNSSTVYVASIASSGLASTYSKGSSTITASFTQTSGTVTGSTTLTVTAPTLVSIVIIDNSIVIPGPNSVANAQTAAGTHHQFYAFGIYTDGGERNITGLVQWTSAPVAVATVTHVGVATGLVPGTATITATDRTTRVTQNVPLVVTNATVTAIVVSPVNQTIAPFTRLAVSALGEFSDGTTQDITGDANWSSTNTAVATVTGGSATGVSNGSTTIQATFGGVTGSAPLNVSGASLVSVAVFPSTAGIAIGTRRAFTAIGIFSDGTKQTLSSQAAWSVTPSGGSIATVDTFGVVTGVGAGTATVTARLGTISNSATISVQNLRSIAAAKTAAAVGSQEITVTPGSATIAAGTATQFTATATLEDGTTQNVSLDVTWISTTPGTAIINDGMGFPGWASGITAGDDTIGAVFSGQYFPVRLTVTDATVTSIAITPATPQTITLGTAKQYKATATFSDSTTQDLSFQVTWTSSDPAVAVTTRLGAATSTGVGSTMVKAAININGSTASDDKALTVAPAP
jgi:trimeric autotransporter adhesin